jgi:Domain of unknown function (DUF4832)
MRGRALGVWVCLVTAALIARAPAGEVVVRPEAAPGPLDNPLKGWCPYANAGPIRQPYSMVFLYTSWKDLEPEEGRYAFDRWEQKAWSVPEAAGKHVVLRVYVDYPSRPSGLPDWLKGKVALTRYTEHGGGLSPDYDNPRLIAALARLIEAMGRRYDGHPRVAFIELGLLGFWGEWHTWPRDALYAKPETERQAIDAYRRAFPHKILMARYARGDAGRQPWLGFHDDLFPEDSDNGHDWSFLAGLRRSGRDGNWQRAAIGGEMVPHRAKEWLGKGAEQTLTMIDRGHFSWVGPYCPALDRSQSPEFVKTSQAVVRRLGYQFRLTELRHAAEVAKAETITVTIRGVNEGVAPFYYPWRVDLALIDDSGKPAAQFPVDCDIRTWLPGSFDVAGRAVVSVSAGRYKLALGIIDPWSDRPAIRFANALPIHEGWTVLSTVVIGRLD